MATQKISEMTEAIILQDEDYVPIVQSELNKKIKIEYLRDYNKLHNKPTLNGITIENNKLLKDYNITKENQGIQINGDTFQTLELEVPTNQELEQRSDVNKAITIATADKMAKETAHQTMSKEYQPNSQDKLKEGEKQPVSYKAVKDYVDILENKVDENERDIEEKYSTLNSKVDENERDIEAKVTALDQKTSQKDEELEELINTNEQDIEQKVSSLQETVNNNKQNIEQKVNTLEQKVDTNERDIEEKVRVVNENIDTIEENIDTIEENIDTIEENIDTIEANIDNLNNKDNEIINIIDYGGKTSNGNEYHGESSDYGLEIEKAEGNYYQEKTNGYQLFDASKLPSKAQNGAYAINNGDGSFTIGAGGSLPSTLDELPSIDNGFSQMPLANLTGDFNVSYRIEKEELKKLIRVGKLKINETNVYPYHMITITYDGGEVELRALSGQVHECDITNEILNSNTLYAIIRIYGYNGQSIKTGTIKPMIYQDGDGAWERFTGGEPAPSPEYPLEPKFFKPKEFVSVSKNLLDNTKPLSDGNGTGTPTKTGVSVTGRYYCYYEVSVKPNTDYYISYQHSGDRRTVSVYSKTPFTSINYIKNINSVSGDTFNSGDNSTVCILFYCSSGTQGTSEYNYVMLNKGTIAQEYAPFTGQDTTPLNIELCSLPNGVRDTYENGVITRRVGKVVFDGSDDETWALQGSPVLSNAKCFFIQISGKQTGAIDNILCNKMRLKYSGTNGAWTIDEAFVCSGNTSTQYPSCYFNFPSNITSLDLLKKYLQSNPIEVWYELEIPTTEYYSFPIIPSYFNYTNAWHDSEVEANDIQWKAKTYDPLEAQNDFIEEDYIKIIETDDMISTSSNRGGAELLAMDGAYEQVATKGYQLFDQRKLPTKIAGGATITNNNDGSFTISGSGQLSDANTISARYEKSDIPLKAGKLTIKLGSITLPYVYVILYKNGGTIYKSMVCNGVDEMSIDVEDEFLNSDGWFVTFGITSASGQTIKGGTIKPMLYQDGDGTFEPFTGCQPSPSPDYKQDMKAVDVNDVISDNGSFLNHDDFESGQLTWAGGVDYSSTDFLRTKEYYKVKSGQIIKRNTLTIIFLYDKDKTYLGNTKVGIKTTSGHSKLDYVVEKEVRYIRVVITKSTYDSEQNIMFSINNMPITYRYGKYSTTSFPLTLRALPNGLKDTYENGVVTRRVKEVTFDNNNTWYDYSPASAVEGINVFYIPSSSSPVSVGMTANKLVCNMFKPINPTNSFDISQLNTIRIGIGSNSIYVCLDSARFPTLDDWTNYLQSNPLTLWYELATPTTEVLDTPFIETYHPWTNIWTDSEVDGHMKIGFKNRFGEFYTKKEVDELIKEAIAKIGTQMIK